MGAEQTTLNTANTTVETPTHSNSNSNSDLAAQILKVAAPHYKRYHKQFKSVQLCQDIGIALANKLENFSQFQLETIYKKQNGTGIPLQAVPLAKEGTKFEIIGPNGEKVPDFFGNTYVSVPEGLSKSGPQMRVPYILNRVVSILESRNPEKEAFERKKFKQKGGENGEKEKLDNFRKALNVIEGQVGEEKAPKKKEELDLSIGQLLAQQAANNKPREEEEVRVTEEKTPQKEEIVLEEKVNTPKNNINVPKNNKPKNNTPKVNTPKVNTPKVNTPKNNKPKNNINVPKNNTENKLSKKNLCGLIAHHYMVRANLVAAIVSALPLNNVRNSFCYQRIEALQNGRLCLPSGYEKTVTMEAEQASKELAPYLRYFGKNKCQEKGGSIRYQGKERMEAIFTGTSELNKQFTGLLSGMRRRYILHLKTLKSILEELTQNANLSNEDLIRLSQSTKKTLDTMYTECQYDYIMGAITLLQIEDQMPKMSPVGQENLKNSLKERQ